MENRTMNTRRNVISERTLTVIGVIQALMLAAYGMCAVLLHRRMMTYDIYSISNSGSPVHFCYMATVIAGLFLIIYRLVKERKEPGFFKSAGFLSPAAVTATALIFSQANTVYTSTSGGSITGMLGYLFRAGLSGSDPIDSFVYGSMTIPKYVLVIVIGFACAPFTALRSKGGEAVKLIAAASDAVNAPDSAADVSADAAADETAAGDTAEATNKVITVDTDAIRKKVSAGRRIIIPLMIALIIGGGIFTYVEFFSMTKYDLSEYTTDVEISGYNGEAYASAPFVDYDMLDTLAYEDAYHLSDVIDTVDYRITPSEGLSNGDIIRIEAVYDEDLARRYRIKLTNLSREVKVTDAIVRVTSSDITSDILKEAIASGNDVIKMQLEDFGAQKISIEHMASYFIAPDNCDSWTGTYNDSMEMVYKVTYYKTGWMNDELIKEDAYYTVTAIYLTDASDVENWDMEAYRCYEESVDEAVADITSLNGNGYKVVELK